MGERREGRYLGDEPDDLLMTGVLVGDLFCVRVKRGQRRHGADEHPHRMRIVVKPVDELFDVFVDERVVGDLAHPRVERRGPGEFAVQE